MQPATVRNVSKRMQVRPDRLAVMADNPYDAHWRRLRRAFLAANPLCARHLERALTVAANEVDHKIPIAVRPDLRLEWDNLQSLCKPCHSAKTYRETGRARRG